MAGAVRRISARYVFRHGLRRDMSCNGTNRSGIRQGRQRHRDVLCRPPQGSRVLTRGNIRIDGAGDRSPCDIRQILPQRRLRNRRHPAGGRFRDGLRRRRFKSQGADVVFTAVETLAGLLGQASGNRPLRGHRQTEDGGRHFKQNGAMQKIEIGNVKRDMTGKHLVGDAAESVNVRPCRAYLSTPLFRGAVERLPAVFPPWFTHPFVVASGIGKPQIQDLGRSAFRDHDAFRHQMAMDFIIGMRQIQGAG